MPSCQHLSNAASASRNKLAGAFPSLKLLWLSSTSLNRWSELILPLLYPLWFLLKSPFCSKYLLILPASSLSNSLPRQESSFFAENKSLPSFGTIMVLACFQALGKYPSIELCHVCHLFVAFCIHVRHLITTLSLSRHTWFSRVQVNLSISW